jgi:hypothetical protein
MLTAQLTPGRSRGIPRRTVVPPQVDIGGVQSVAVPAFASVLYPMIDSTNTASVLINGQRIRGAGPLWRRTVAAAQETGIRLPIGTNFVQVDNNSGVLLDSWLVFELALS